jgi:hypothetical protein
VHNIHLNALEAKQIICETCHDYRGEFSKPEAGPGQLLVCEVCHSNGNYIKIHIEGNILENAKIDSKWITQGTGHQCDTCHIGEFANIHFAPLNSQRERINELIEESRENPAVKLNISYL